MFPTHLVQKVQQECCLVLDHLLLPVKENFHVKKSDYCIVTYPMLIFSGVAHQIRVANHHHSSWILEHFLIHW